MIDSTRSPDLHSAMDANMVAFWSAYGRGAGCTLQQAGEGVVFFTGIAHPLFNGVPRAIFDAADAESVVDRLQADIAVHAAPAFWWLGPRTKPDDLASTLERRGLTHAGEVPGMALDLDTTPDRLPDIAGFSVERVSSQAQQLTWARTAAAGTGFSSSAARALERVEASLGDAAYAAQHRYVGYLADAPVATAALVLDSGVAGIYAVATVSEARRRGIGRYLTARLLIEARAMGYRVATLQASPMGLPVYQKLGFRNVCGYRLYLQTAR